MKPLSSFRIEAGTVNHNTSRYMELMLRSLLAKHSSDLHLSVSVYDNASQDDTTDLRAFVASKGIPILQSGFTTDTRNNSHGEVLRNFVMAHPNCTHYLFLDADVCFLHDHTLDRMLEELEEHDDAFGIGPRMAHWNAENGREFEVDPGANPDLYQSRLHPCCALVKNTELFRCIVKEIGLSCMKFLWANSDEYVDTFRLMTKVMRTHGFHHLISSQRILHFFCVSYVWEPVKHLDEIKAKRRDTLLLEYRRQASDETGVAQFAL